MNTEHPILFSSEMVRAILDGRKTQTRRPVKPQPKHSIIEGLGHITIGMDPAKDGAVWYDADCINPGREVRCPFGRIGETLWVCETWALSDDIDGRELVAYRAGGTRLIAPGPTVTHGEHRCVRSVTRWTPSIHMPRWACRLFLRITDIRVQRVRDISEEDAKAEGIAVGPSEHCGACGDYGVLGYTPEMSQDCPCCGMARLNFLRLWDSMHTKQGLDSGANPWVWAISFEVIK